MGNSKVIILLLIMVSLLKSGNLFADSIDEKMKTWLGEQGVSFHSNEGAHVQGQTAGYYTGPSGGMRFPVSYLQSPISITAPKFSVGCGGVDFSLGGIKLMDGEQILQQLEQVTTTMVPVAIMMGLQVVTPQLTSVLQEFQEKVDRFTKMSMDTCEAATAVVGAVKDGAIQDGGCIAMEMAKNGTDYAIARTRCAQEKGAAALLAQASPDEANANGDFLKGNIAWVLMKKSGAFQNNPTDLATMEIVMNLVGTYVISSEYDAEGNATGKPDLASPKKYAPEISAANSQKWREFENAYIGSVSDPTPVAGPAPDPNAPATVTKLDGLICGKNTRKFADDGCMTVLNGELTIESSNTGKEVLKRLQKILDNIYKDVDYNEWQTAEKKIVNDAKVPIYRFLIALAAFAPQTSAVTDQMLIDFADMYARHIFAGHILAVSNTLYKEQHRIGLNGETAGEYEKQIYDVMRSISERLEAGEKSINMYTRMVERTQQYDKILAGRIGSSLADSSLWGY